MSRLKRSLSQLKKFLKNWVLTQFFLKHEYGKSGGFFFLTCECSDKPPSGEEKFKIQFLIQLGIFTAVDTTVSCKIYKY
jgi:hypothetical protein